MDPVKLIEHHTLIPYWESVSPFPLSASQYRELVQAKHANSRYRLNCWRRQPMQFCLQCVQEDGKSLGEPIWRRTHQLPGVSVCLKHRCWLSHTCESCGWQSSIRFLSYPSGECPNGHLMRTPKRPAASMDLPQEVAFARWSNELLAFRFGDRTQLLQPTLSNLASLHGVQRLRTNETSNSGAERLLRRHRHPVIQNYGAFLERVSNAPHKHVMDPAFRRTPAKRPHPVAVMLCVKAICGVRSDTLAELRKAEVVPSTPASDDWQGQWERLPPNSANERYLLLPRYFAHTAQAASARTVSQLEDVLGAALGLTGGSMHAYRTNFPGLTNMLKSLRPELWVRRRGGRDV